MKLEVDQLSFAYHQEPVLRNISFSADSGQIIALLGSNGVGKSTLFRCLLGFLKIQSGQILLNKQNIDSFSQSELSKEIAYIPQSYSPTFNYTVEDSVLMGLTGQLRITENPGSSQLQLVHKTLQDLGIEHLAKRGSRQISGGERQLMLLARALVQNAGLLLMDEPTASLDYGNSCKVMERIQQLGKAGYSVIFSTHDPNQAFRYANRVLAMHNGTLLADGTPQQVLSETLLSSLYGIPVAVCRVNVAGEIYPVCLPMKNLPEQ